MDDDGPARRPGWHWTFPDGWLNDPLGVTWHGDRYHLFFQCVPGSTTWQPWCSWGHATSPDLVTWTPEPVALSPGDGDLGCWSGGLAVPDDGPPVIFYTSVNEPDLHLGAVRVATPVDDGWRQWRKGEVVVRAPEGLRVFRDPTVLRDGDGWRMLVGAGYPDGRAAVVTFTSPDLADWRYDGVLAARPTTETDGVWTGSAWECPQLLRIGDQHLLVVSVWDDERTCHVAAATGTYEGGRFAVRRWSRLTHGGHYAATAFTDTGGRPCLIFWIRDVGDPVAGWAGALSVPYVVSLDDDGPLLAPHPAVRAAVGGLPALWELGQTQLLLDRGLLEICTGRTVIGPVAFPWAGPG